MYWLHRHLLLHRYNKGRISIASSNVAKLFHAQYILGVLFNDLLFYHQNRIPFDWNNPIGYLIVIVIEYVILVYEYIIVACTLALGSGAFWYAISATKEIQCILDSIEDRIEAKKSQPNDEFKALFSEYIYAHGIVKQLSIKFRNNVQKLVVNLKSPFTEWSRISPT